MRRKYFWTRILGCLSLCAALAGAGLPASFAQVDVLLPTDSVKKKGGKSTDEEYILKPGDRIKITVYPEDEFIKGGEMKISSEGNITLPLVGKIEVANKPIRIAESEIRNTIDSDYLVNPEVVIEVLKQGEQSTVQVVLLGSVRKPGSYTLPQGETKITLLKLMSEAGGFSEVANIRKIKIIRTVNGEKQIIKANAETIMSGDEPDVELQTGDIVNVAESLF
jgi:polysaccharide export outer membrane protein